MTSPRASSEISSVKEKSSRQPYNLFGARLWLEGEPKILSEKYISLTPQQIIDLEEGDAKENIDELIDSEPTVDSKNLSIVRREVEILAQFKMRKAKLAAGNTVGLNKETVGEDKKAAGNPAQITGENEAKLDAEDERVRAENLAKCELLNPVSIYKYSNPNLKPIQEVHAIALALSQESFKENNSMAFRHHAACSELELEFHRIKSLYFVVQGLQKNFGMFYRFSKEMTEVNALKLLIDMNMQKYADFVAIFPNRKSECIKFSIELSVFMHIANRDFSAIVDKREDCAKYFRRYNWAQRMLSERETAFREGMDREHKESYSLQVQAAEPANVSELPQSITMPNQQNSAVETDAKHSPKKENFIVSEEDIQKTSFPKRLCFSLQRGKSGPAGFNSFFELAKVRKQTIEAAKSKLGF